MATTKERLESLLETSIEMHMNLANAIASGTLSPKQIQKAIRYHYEYTHEILFYTQSEDVDRLNSKISDSIVQFNVIVLGWKED